MPNTEKNTLMPQCDKNAVNDRMCYIVQCSAGQYDDHHTWIVGIYDNAFDAESLKKEIEKDIDIIRNTPEPFIMNYNNATKQELDLYDKLSDEYYKAEEFNSVNVLEYPFGKSCR